MTLRLKMMPALIAGAFAGLAGSAVAGPIVTQWSYSNNATFTSATFEATGTGATINSAYELSWGANGGNYTSPSNNASSNRSALTIGKGATGNDRFGGGPVAGTINTTIGGTPNVSLGQVQNGTTFTHWNNPINENFKELLGGTVRATLTLTPLLPSPGPTENLAPLDFTFVFQETSNDPLGSCAGNTPKPCADLFALVGFTNVNQMFTYDEHDYYASIYILDPMGTVSPIATLLPAECAALGLSVGCQGFRTEEQAQTTAQFVFSIATEKMDIPVPAPASIALMGLGLAGLGFASRRRRAS